MDLNTQSLKIRLWHAMLPRESKKWKPNSSKGIGIHFVKVSWLDENAWVQFFYDFQEVKE